MLLFNEQLWNIQITKLGFDYNGNHFVEIPELKGLYFYFPRDRQNHD